MSNMGRIDKSKILNIFLILFIFFSGVIYFFYTNISASYTNTDINSFDQNAYLDNARIMVQTNHKYLGDRNRMPFFPFLLSLVYDKNLETFFYIGKNINIYFSYLYLIFLFLIFKKYFPLLTTVNLILIIAFAVFIFRAPLVQAELTFYFLFFLSFWRLAVLFTNPSPKNSVIAGIFLAIAHLTKYAVLPLVGIFILVFGTRQIYQQLRKKINRKILNRQWISLGLTIASFLLIISPYLLQTKKIYGQYFYNVNSNFYMWYDSWQECASGTLTHGDHNHYPNLPKEAIPGPLKYLTTHRPEDIFKRFTNGFRANLFLFQNSISYGYHWFILYLLFVLCFSCSFLVSKKLKTLIKNYLFLIIFFLATVLIYSLLFAWYAPIINANRFILIIFLPVIFSLTMAIRNVNKLIALDLEKKFNYFLFIVICYQIYITISYKLFIINGGF